MIAAAVPGASMADRPIATLLMAAVFAERLTN
jgi:hypothetical protein